MNFSTTGGAASSPVGAEYLSPGRKPWVDGPLPGVSAFPGQHHPGAHGAALPHLRRGAFKNSPPDLGGVASLMPGWLACPMACARGYVLTPAVRAGFINAVRNPVVCHYVYEKATC